MAKNTTPFSYKNVTYSISTLHFEAIAVSRFDGSFSEHKEEVKEFVRSLIKDKNKVSAQIIEDSIFLHFLPKKVQKKLISLVYIHGLCYNYGKKTIGVSNEDL